MTVSYLKSTSVAIFQVVSMPYLSFTPITLLASPVFISFSFFDALNIWLHVMMCDHMAIACVSHFHHKKLVNKVAVRVPHWSVWAGQCVEG